MPQHTPVPTGRRRVALSNCNADALTGKASLEAGSPAPVVGVHEQRFFPARGQLEALSPGAACDVVRPACRQQA
jgi:hypothetical protein